LRAAGPNRTKIDHAIFNEELDSVAWFEMEMVANRFRDGYPTLLVEYGFHGLTVCHSASMMVMRMAYWEGSRRWVIVKLA
jgi:hypothetical protein